MLSTLIIAAPFVAMTTYLVVDSVLLDRPRNWYGRFYVTTCPWCTSAWIAAATTLTVRPEYPVLWWGTCWWLAVIAYFATLLLAVKASEA